MIKEPNRLVIMELKDMLHGIDENDITDVLAATDTINDCIKENPKLEPHLEADLEWLSDRAEEIHYKNFGKDLELAEMIFT